MHRSTLFRWKNAKPDWTIFQIQAVIKQLFIESDETYGSRRLSGALQQIGWEIGRRKTRKLMTDLQLKPHYPKVKYVRKPVASFAENWLNQVFDVLEKDTVWAGDITYIYTAEGWLYLAVVIDLFSRKIVGWHCSDEIDTSLCEQALRLAIHRRKPPRGLLFHSDRGSQYSSRAFRKCLADFGIEQSQSRAGKCTDNAVTERFFRSLKTEKLYRENYTTKAEALVGVAEYIEDFYNPKRLHSSLGNLSPMMYEEQQMRLGY